MRHLRLWLMPMILLALLTPSTGGARPPLAIGQRIELRAFKPQGVPLHRQPRASLFGRTPDGSHAVIQALTPNERWLQIQLDADHRTAWIVRKYVRRVLEILPGDGPMSGTATVSEIERQV